MNWIQEIKNLGSIWNNSDNLLHQQLPSPHATNNNFDEVALMQGKEKDVFPIIEVPQIISSGMAKYRDLFAEMRVLSM